MNRAGENLGPYDQADAEARYANGSIISTDLIWKDGMPAWRPASEVFAHVSMKAGVPPPIPSQYKASAPVESAKASSANSAVLTPPLRSAAPSNPDTPLPPKLHWALLLLFTVLTFGIFMIVWLFIQSNWIKKIDPLSNATVQFIGYLVLFVIAEVMKSTASNGSSAFAGLLYVGAYVTFYFGAYSMRRSMLNHYNSAEKIDLQLSKAMVFFFSILYLQSHMTRIAKWKTSGTLSPQ